MSPALNVTINIQRRQWQTSVTQPKVLLGTPQTEGLCIPWSIVSHNSKGQSPQLGGSMVEFWWGSCSDSLTAASSCVSYIKVRPLPPLLKRILFFLDQGPSFLPWSNFSYFHRGFVFILISFHLSWHDTWYNLKEDQFNLAHSLG